MAAQEFSSPGAHMSGQDNGTNYKISQDQIGYRNPNDTRSPTQIYIDRGLEYSNETGKWIKPGNMQEDYDDYINRAYKYNQYYMKYNNDLFRQQMEYDQYMSNTAIQRQMADLKKAGINPILAGRLGGAAYKGVNAPYVSINPGSTLSAMSNFYQTESNNYYKEKQLELDREKMTQEERIADKKIAAELYKANLDSQTLLEIAKQNNLTKEQIAELEENYKIQIQEMWDKVMLEINKNDIDNSKELNRNNIISNIISSSIRGIGYMVGAMIIKNKFDNGKGGGISPSGIETLPRMKFNDIVKEKMASGKMFDVGQAGLGLGLLGIGNIPLVPVF